MNARRKLIPAAALLLISAIILSTASYAWFSMNTTVSATNMQITAKSDSTYLLISKTNTTATAIQGENLTTVDMAGSASLIPASPALTDDEVAYLTVAEGHNKVGGDAITVAGEKVIDDETAPVVTNWFTASAAASNAATINNVTAKQLTAFTGYVDVQTMYLTVAAGANAANNLTVTPTFTQQGGGQDLTAVKAIIVTSDGGYYEMSSANNGTALDIKGDNTSLTSATVLTVTVYIYVDGDETPVYTNNTTNLKGVSLSLTYNVSVVG